MNNIYDNGEKLLGTKKAIQEYTKIQKKHFKKIGDDYVVETMEEILEDIKDYKDTDILSINYDNGMGFIIDLWQENDRIGA